MVAFQLMESPSPLRIWLRGFALAAALATTPGALAETWVLPAATDARILRIGPDPSYQNSNYQQDILSVFHNSLTFIQRGFGGGGESPDRPQLLLESGPGVPRLIAHLDAATGETVLSWRGVGTAVLQERSALESGDAWTDVRTPVGVEGTRSVVRVAPADDVRLFRRRTP